MNIVVAESCTCTCTCIFYWEEREREKKNYMFVCEIRIYVWKCVSITTICLFVLNFVDFWHFFHVFIFVVIVVVPFHLFSFFFFCFIWWVFLYTVSANGRYIYSLFEWIWRKSNEIQRKKNIEQTENCFAITCLWSVRKQLLLIRSFASY